MRFGPRNLLCCRAGAGAVEFAFTLPILLLVVAGIAELGRAIYTGDVLANAVREAGRSAIVRGSASGSPMTVSQVEDLVRTRAATLTTSDVAVTVTYSPNNDPGSQVTIQARYPFAFVVPPFSSFGPITIARATNLYIAN